MDHIIYTDGGCHNEDGDMKGIGSFAWLEPVDLSKESVDVHGGYVVDTTNNRTEMMAIIEGLKMLSLNDEECNVMIISDSGYVVNGYTLPSHLARWVNKGWKTSTNTPVSNVELWQEFMRLSWHVGMNFTLIRGHKKDANPIHSFWNDICDQACTYIIKNCKNMKDISLNYNFKTKQFTVLNINKHLWRFTFGGGHEHEGFCQPILALNADEARTKMVELYGTKWAFQYSEDEWELAKRSMKGYGFLCNIETDLEIIEA